MSLSPKTLVTIPAYNEEKTVRDVVKSVMDLYPAFKVLVIDDGSSDKTVKNAKKAGADVVSFPFHCGGSFAILAGYQIAAKHSFDYTVKIDADGQHKPEEISKLLVPLSKGETDITVGSRYRKRENNSDYSTVKAGGRLFSSIVVSTLGKIEVTDVTSGMRAWNRKAIDKLMRHYAEKRFVEDSVFWVAETLLASRLGLRMKEVPIEVLPRTFGRSKSFSRYNMLMYPIRFITTLIEEIRT